jgi:hypothetical protein
MAMGRREDQQKQEPLWIAHTELALAPGHPFYEKLSELLDAEGFDFFVEGVSAKFYAEQFGSPSQAAGLGDTTTVHQTMAEAGLPSTS